MRRKIRSSTVRQAEGDSSEANEVIATFNKNCAGKTIYQQALALMLLKCQTDQWCIMQHAMREEGILCRAAKA